ncbi:MAG TPA: hypothetical protein VGG64_08945 [Pirellulales bacterium]|jgi:hypothetical protein
MSVVLPAWEGPHTSTLQEDRRRASCQSQKLSNMVNPGSKSPKSERMPRHDRGLLKLFAYARRFGSATSCAFVSMTGDASAT